MGTMYDIRCKDHKEFLTIAKTCGIKSTWFIGKQRDNLWKFLDEHTGCNLEFVSEYAYDEDNSVWTDYRLKQEHSKKKREEEAQ